MVYSIYLLGELIDLQRIAAIHFVISGNQVNGMPNCLRNFYMLHYPFVSLWTRFVSDQYHFTISYTVAAQLL